MRHLGTTPQIETPAIEVPDIDGPLATPLADHRLSDVDVWRVPLRRDEATRQRLAQTLSAAERARVERFRFDRHRERFIVAHGALRKVLSGYVGRSPEALRFDAEAGGKPFLENGCAVDGAADEWRFNLSHSADLALVAVSEGREVGVDVERIEPKRDLEALARRFFAPEERDALRRLAPEQRVVDFFRIWTLKEAYLKASGTGLRRPLDSFAVAARDDGPTRLLRADAGDADRWRFHGLEVASGYAGAVVVEVT